MKKIEKTISNMNDIIHGNEPNRVKVAQLDAQKGLLTIQIREYWTLERDIEEEPVFLPGFLQNNILNN